MRFKKSLIDSTPPSKSMKHYEPNNIVSTEKRKEKELLQEKVVR